MPQNNAIPKTAKAKAAKRLSNDERRTLVQQLLRAHMSQADVAAHLRAQGFAASEATISRDVTQIRDELKAARLTDAAAQRDLEVDILNADEIRWRGVLAGLKGNDTLPRQVKVYEIILRIMERRSKLIGLDAPTKFEGDLKLNGPIPVELYDPVAALNDIAPDA